MKEECDRTLDALLDLDGTVFVVDPETGHWVKFVVLGVPISPERPHGIGYSLTLHGPNGERLVGFDNAHPAAGQKYGEPQDHRHPQASVTNDQSLRVSGRGSVTARLLGDS